MKKGKIYLISIDKILNNVLEEQLNEIFGIEYEVKGILYETLETIDSLDCDVIVSTCNILVNGIHRKNSKNIPIIFTKRTIQLDNLLEILSIESGSDVSVVSNVIEEAEVTVELLKEMGISHINLIPYAPDCGLTIKKTAITMGEDLVPEGIENIICMGEKYIDISTIVEIFISLKMPIEKIDVITRNYTRKIARYSNYSRNLNKTLQGMFEVLNEGFAFVNSEDKIVFCNKCFSKLLNWNHNKIIIKNYKTVLKEANIINLLVQKKEQHIMKLLIIKIKK